VQQRVVSEIPILSGVVFVDFPSPLPVWVPCISPVCVHISLAPPHGLYYRMEHLVSYVHQPFCYR